MDLSQYKWQGYARTDGRKGIRNKVLVVYTVECAAFVAKEIARQANNKDVDVIGFSGCTDNAYAIRLLVSLIKHPNVGAVLAVGLGCEYVQPQRLADAGADAGKPSDWLYIQNEGGTAKAIEKGLGVVLNMLTELKKTPRVEMGFCDLVIGAECGGSDYTSGLAGNTVVGAFYDKLVDTGGTAVFEEIVEAVGLIDLLQKRAANDKAREELTQTYNKAMDYCKSVRQYSISPGNFVGGLSTIEEKSMGAFIKSGTKPIDGVLQVSEAPTRKGLWLLDSTPDPHWMQLGITNPNDNEGLMDLIGCGAQVVFLVTGRGNVVGSAVAPVIKITGNHETFMNMNDDMDFDASAVLYGSKRLEECADELAAYVAGVCGGGESRAERLGHKEYFIPYKYQNNKRCGDD